jgi:hypothetical protein
MKVKKRNKQIVQKLRLDLLGGTDKWKGPPHVSYRHHHTTLSTLDDLVGNLLSQSVDGAHRVTRRQ